MVVHIHSKITMNERIHGKDEVSGSSPDRGSKLEIFQKPWRNVHHFL